MDNNDILVGIVTYNPDMRRLVENIGKIGQQGVERILVIDNGSKNINEIDDFKTSNISIIKNVNNFGVAYALNQIGNEALTDGYDYFLTLDQDSVIDDNFFSNITRISIRFKDEQIGIFCPYINRNNDFVFDDSFKYVLSTITSGSLVLTKAWKEIGGFWNYLFIDEVDHEFCYRIRKFGYKIVESNSCCINHIIGNPDGGKTIMGHAFHPTNHSAFRRYFMTRNSIIMMYLYPREKDPFPHRIRMLLRVFISIMLCENNKKKKIVAMIKGVFGALKWIVTCNKTGSTPGRDV